MTLADTARELRRLHADPELLQVVNVWDVATARAVAALPGTRAIATASHSIAAAFGYPDGEQIPVDLMLDMAGRIARAVDVPVTADLEAGYDDVAATVRRAVEVGAVGGNLEDQVGGVLFDIEEAADRIAAARAAAPCGTFVINARTDTYFGGATGEVFDETVERATRYVEAGADCVFVPAVDDEETIRRLAEAIPAPLNLVAGLSNVIPAPTLFALGVKRISLGGSIARAALTAVERAGRELLETGTLDFLDGAIGYADVQSRFRR